VRDICRAKWSLDKRIEESVFKLYEYVERMVNNKVVKKVYKSKYDGRRRS